MQNHLTHKERLNITNKITRQKAFEKKVRGGGDRGKEIRIGLDEELSLSVSFHPYVLVIKEVRKLWRKSKFGASCESDFSMDSS